MGKILGIVTILSIVAMIAIGWVMNLITLLGNGYETLAQTIVGAVGVLAAPVGAIVYWIAG